MKTIPGFKLRKLGNEFILVGESIDLVNFNKMLTLNESAAYLWRRASEDPNKDFDAEQMAQWLMEEYQIDENTPLPYEQALNDAGKTIRQWLDAGIVTE